MNRLQLSWKGNSVKVVLSSGRLWVTYCIVIDLARETNAHGEKPSKHKREQRK